MEKLKGLKLNKSRITSVKFLKDVFVDEKSGVTYTEIPELCAVKIESMPGEKSFIRIELWLPSNWNSIFLGLGNGGMAGNIYYRELVKYVKQGYAAANTDLGTPKGREYGINNPDVWKDFGWRATHLMTVLGKTVLREYYGKKEDYSYFVGRSTGGQQAFSLMQRFPDDYNGIIAGVPANNRVYLHTYFLWNYVHLHPKNGTALFFDQQITAKANCAVDFFS